MKKFGLFIAGGIAALIFLSTIGPMLALTFSIILLYFIYKQFLKAESTGGKITIGIIGLIVLAVSIPNIPALIGVGAAYVLYLVYKNWNTNKPSFRTSEPDQDPFTNFDRQWNELKKY